eukprot:2369108-Rhodomonas_salina.1
MSPRESGCCLSEVDLMLLHLNAGPPATSESMAMRGQRASGLLACVAPPLTLPASANTSRIEVKADVRRQVTNSAPFLLISGLILVVFLVGMAGLFLEHWRASIMTTSFQRYCPSQGTRLVSTNRSGTW